MCKNILEVMHSIRCYTDNTCLMYPEPPNSKDHTIKELEWIHGKLADVRESMEEFTEFREHAIEISEFVCKLQKIIDDIHAKVITTHPDGYEKDAMVYGRDEFKKCYNSFLMMKRGGLTYDQYEFLNID